MIVISTREFRANQTKFLDMARNGEDVILKSRSSGSFKLIPVETEVENPCFIGGFPKGRLLQHERRPFSVRLMAFCKVKDGLLGLSVDCLDDKMRPPDLQVVVMSLPCGCVAALF